MQCLVRYCRAMDRNDAPLGYSVWHADGTASYPPAFFGSGQAFIDRVIDLHRSTYTSHMHRLSLPVIVVEAFQAASESYVHAILWSKDENLVRQTSIFGRYLDRWSFRDGAWRIDHRDYVHEFDTVQVVEPGPLGKQKASASKRDSTDPSYMNGLIAKLSG